MKIILMLCLAVLLGACNNPSFVGDARPIPVTSQTPEHFELPARFAFARTVYGSPQTAGAEEMELWENLAERAESLGNFSPLVGGVQLRTHGRAANLIETARQQRFNYLILVQMHPTTGAADIIVYHTGSGGVMATAQAVSPTGGRRGFWGGRIRNPARLDPVTLKIAHAALPVIEELLRGMTQRQH
ncbi:hypothetical protein [Cochlodiniinecator piscidefendens]|uniref:hypothetical protein n=1 Tax=Cochlodiniinecator piscidefendens TaxID=2715756 RepID=UPI00140E31D8|nr:hypothetical protein [Cochlodiniinecator piscidefendens]